MKYPVEMIAPVSQRTPISDKNKTTPSKSVQKLCSPELRSMEQDSSLSQGSPFVQ